MHPSSVWQPLMINAELTMFVSDIFVNGAQP